MAFPTFKGDNRRLIRVVGTLGFVFGIFRVLVWGWLLIFRRVPIFVFPLVPYHILPPESPPDNPHHHKVIRLYRAETCLRL